MDGGSSPRVRGAGVDDAPSAVAHGIIPARAGSSPLQTRSGTPTRDHPRACGEQRKRALAGRDGLGSSPRVRGAGLRRLARRVVIRIIPARAGSSLWPYSTWGAYSDHPRACGEQKVALTRQQVVPGSSPRVRGAVLGHPHERGVRRIIPARAGSSPSPSLSCRAQADHPLACGEQLPTLVVGTKYVGSFPRVRGAVATTA